MAFANDGGRDALLCSFFLLGTTAFAFIPTFVNYLPTYRTQQGH